MSAAAVHEEGLLARSDPSFTALADDSKRQELPPGVWREVLLHLRPEERFVASMVCKAWRGHALSLLIPDLEVSLNSGDIDLLLIQLQLLQTRLLYVSAQQLNLQQLTVTAVGISTKPGTIITLMCRQLRSAVGQSKAHTLQLYTPP